MRFHTSDVCNDLATILSSSDNVFPFPVTSHKRKREEFVNTNQEQTNKSAGKNMAIE